MNRETLVGISSRNGYDGATIRFSYAIAYIRNHSVKPIQIDEVPASNGVTYFKGFAVENSCWATGTDSRAYTI